MGYMTGNGARGLPRKVKTKTPAGSTEGNPILGPPRPGKGYKKTRDKQVASLPDRKPKSGGPVRPDSPYNRGMGPTLAEAAANRRRTSGGGGAGGGGGGAAGGGKPAKTKPSKPAETGSKPAAPAAPGAPTDDNKFWNDLFDPARREIERQQALLDSQKAASQTAWDSYNKWAEAKRAESAGLLTSSQKAAQDSYNAQRTETERRITGYVDAARGGTGAPPQGGDLAQATGSGALAEQQAALARVGQSNSAWQAANDKIAQQQMLDQQSIQQARATEGTGSINSAYAKAAAALAQNRGALESKVGEAKLDRFYRDRQYGLDRETLDWTKSLQGQQLDVQKGQLALENRKLTVQEKIKAGEMTLAQARAQLDAQYKAGTLTLKDRNAKISAAKAANAQYNTTNKNALGIAKRIRDGLGDFTGMDTNEQGEKMRQTAAEFMAAGIPLAITKKHMAAIFGGRWSNFPAAVAETAKIYGGK